jgi:predicted cobalt transporter CbtA
MLRDNSAVEILLHPATVAMSLVATIGHALQFDLVVAITGAVAANAGTLFTALSIPAFTLAPRIGWLPQGPLTAAAIVVGGVYVLTLLDRVVESIQMRLNDP